jgi:hypothetical protein
MNLAAKIFIFIASLTLSGCLEKPCKTHDFCPQPETAVRYFSVYKPGSWWVYETSDGSKRDSIYVSEYRVEPGQDGEDPCYAWEDQCLEKPCKTHDFCPQPETAVRYFSVYKPGSWWVYETSDGSKRDSIYVSEYRVEPGQDGEDPCYAWEILYDKIQYTCRTKYLTDIGEFHGVNGNLGSCNSSIFTIEERNKGIVGLYSFRNVDTLSNDVNGVKTVSPFYPKSGFDTIYKEVTIWDGTYFFSENIGLIQYASSDLDTFYMTEYFIP